MVDHAPARRHPALGGDTIAAIATPAGRGGIGVVRVSGTHARAIATQVLGRVPRARYATLATFNDTDGAPLDHGLALFFPAPHSFTGEDVLELHGHGSPAALQRVLTAVLARGARAARAGEFTLRAFLNDKLDLAQAEALADLIDAGSAAAARSALRSLTGDFSRALTALSGALTETRALIEAQLDFPDDDIDARAAGDVAARLTTLRERASTLRAQAREGAVLRDGLTLVLAGLPNAGKSSLLNALAAQESAIVSEVPGTTRDPVREHIVLDGLPVHVIDTAGLRAADDPIEREGVRRARAALDTGDHALIVIDDSNPGGGLQALAPLLPPGLAVTIVYNKIDLSGRMPGRAGDALALSCKTGAGLASLRAHLLAVAGYRADADGVFSARTRHLDALARAERALEAAAHAHAARSPELAAEELRLANRALGEITGEVTSEDLLSEIFSRFCIGK